LLFEPTTQKFDPPQTGGVPQLSRLHIEQGTEATANVRGHLLSVNGSIRIRMRHFARMVIQSIAGEACSSETAGAAGRVDDLIPALHVGPPGLYFWARDLPPGQEFLQGPTARPFLLFKNCSGVGFDS
jgi:hypothetical protein